jgi:hypothetical protein
MFIRAPSNYPELLSRHQDLLRKGKYRKAWEVSMAYEKKRIVDDPSWFLSLEHGKVDLLRANAAYKASAFERAFFNAKIAQLVFSRANNSSTGFQCGRFFGSFADEMFEADNIASEALHHMDDGDIERVQNEWRKIERDYERAGGAFARAKIGLHWGLAGPLEKWRLKRRLKTLFEDPDLFGTWSTPDD